MARPARSTNNRNQRNLARRGKKTSWESIGPRQRRKINNSARVAAANIMNDLAERGPGYSGEFRDNWRSIAVGGALQEVSPGQYPYTTRNVPVLKQTIKEMDRVTVLEIVNISPYALYAMDLAPGRWRKPGDEPPIGGIDFGVKYGTRPKGQTFRYDVSGDIPESGEPNVSTAQADWYETYIRSGEISDATRRAIRFAFRQGDSGIMIS